MGVFSLIYEGVKSNIVRPKKPYKLTFAVTLRCNSRCKHCNIWKLQPKNELSIDEIRQFAQANPNFVIVELTGGEPFLRSDLTEIAKVFAEYSKGLYAITMPTNSLVNSEVITGAVRKMLALKKKIVVTLSLDGYRELEDEIRGVKGNYDKVISLYKKFAEIKKENKNFDFKFGFTMIGLNQGKFLETFRRVKEDLPDIKLTDFHLNIGAISEGYYGNNSSLRENILIDREKAVKEVEEIIKAYRKEMGVTFDLVTLGEYIYLKGMLEFLKTGKNPFKRLIGEASVYVDSFGNVYPSILVEKKLGNIKEDGYDLSNILKKGADIIKNDDRRHYTFCDEEASIIGDIPKDIKLLLK
ncbi:MAG: radical SAM/SPASM domain-containing protein [Candidatus Micrarchaeia archaeon]